MKVPGQESLFDNMAEGTKPKDSSGGFAAPSADVSGDGAGAEARIKAGFSHMAERTMRFMDTEELGRQVRDVRALEELGRLNEEEKRRKAAIDPRAKAEQDAFNLVDTVKASDSEFYQDKAAGSPSIMDGYTPPPNSRPMDQQRAQELAESTMQQFGLLDQAGIDAARARRESEAQTITGLPVELLGQDPGQAIRRAKESGPAVEAYAKLYPATAVFLGQFPNLVRDDWENLSWLEKMGRHFTAGTQRGRAQVMLAEVMEDVRQNGITPERIALARRYDQDMKNASGLPLDGWAQKIASFSAEQLPQFAYGLPEAAKYGSAYMGAGIAGAAATGGATTPLVLPMLAVGAKTGYAEFTRKLEGGLAFWELLNMKDAAGNHLDMAAVRVGAEVVGGINAALELWELDTLAKTIPGAKRLMADIGREASLRTLLNPSFRQALMRGAGQFAKFEASEVGQEIAQELTQIASEELNKAYANRMGAKFDKATLSEIKDRLLDIAEKTALGMVPYGGPGIAFTTAKEAFQTPQAKQFMDPFLARIKGDKLAQEAPSAFERLIEENVKAGAFPAKVYMPTAEVRALFQDKSGQVDVEGLREFLDAAGIDRQAFLDSLEHQADVAFDARKLARVLSTDAGQALNAQGLVMFSPREREVHKATLDLENAKATGDPEAIAQAQALLQEAETGISEADRQTLDALFQTDASRGRGFRERIVADMVAAGHTKAQARVTATLIDSNANVWSESTGRPVEDYYRIFGYRIQKTNFGRILENIYRRDYVANFKSEREFFQRFERNEGFRQEVLAKAFAGEMSASMSAAAPTAATETAKSAPENVRGDVAPGATLKAPAAATPAATVPTASSSQTAAGAPAAESLVAPEPTHMVVSSPPRRGGGGGEVLTPTGEAVPFRYAVMERNQVHASHLPTQNFDRNPAFAHTNERDYRSNAAFQERVLKRSTPSEFRPEFLVGQSVDAINGAPIVDDTGSVLGGNSRKMILDLAFERQPESKARYLAALAEALPGLGLDPAVLEGMQEPILVRSLTNLYDAENTSKLISAFNQDFKAANDARTDGISGAKFITPETAKVLAGGLEGFDTIRAFLDDKASQNFVERMFSDGALPDSMKSRIIGPDGTLNVEGNDLVVNILRGAVIDDYALLGRVKDGTMRKVDRVVPHIIRTMASAEEFNLQQPFKAALALLTTWQNNKTTDTFAAYLNQAGLFVDEADPRRDPVVARLAMALAYNKELELARQFGAYADAAALNDKKRQALPGMAPDFDTSLGKVQVPDLPESEYAPEKKPKKKPKKGEKAEETQASPTISFEDALSRIGVVKRSGAGKTQKGFLQDKDAPRDPLNARVVYTADGFFALRRTSEAWGEEYGLPEEVELTQFPDSRGLKPSQLLYSSQNALRVQAMAQEGDFVRYLQDIAGLTGGGQVLARVKSTDSVSRKLEGELQGDMGELRDVLAGTIVYDSLEQAAKAVRWMLEARPASEVVYFADRYSKPMPGGYRDFYFIIRMPNGFLAELQVNTRDMVAAKEGLGHTIYEVARVLEASGLPEDGLGGLVRSALGQASATLYQVAVTPGAQEGLARSLEELSNALPALRQTAEGLVPKPIYDNLVGQLSSATVGGLGSLLNYRVFDQAKPANITGKFGDVFNRRPGRPVDILFQDAARGDITQTPEFMAWFAGSKVVDAEGKPLVVYHGSNADFEAFDPNSKGSQTANPTSFWGHFFTRNTDEASRYTNDFGKKTGGAVYPVYLSVKNPYLMPYTEFDTLATTNVRLNSQGGTPRENYYKTLEILKEKLDEIKAAGHDGIIINPGSRYEELVAFDPTQIKSVFNRGTFDAKDARILYQGGRIQPNLAAVHNLSVENLLFADEMGGLPVPSIGITKAATPYHGFGDITLIARPDMVDPAKTPVFDADAYAPRFPEVLWPKVPMKSAQGFLKGFRDVFREVEENGPIDTLWDLMVNRPNRTEALDTFARSKGARVAYLREQGIEVPITKTTKPVAADFLDAQAGQELLEFVPADAREGEGNAAMANVVRAAIDRYALRAYPSEADQDARADLADMMKRGWLEDDGKGFVKPNREWTILHSAHELGTQIVDQGALEVYLRKAIVDQDAYMAWAKARVEPMFKAAYIKLNGRKADLTLDNVVQAMSGTVRNKESGMTFGGGGARAAMSKRFRSMSEMQDARDQVASPEESEAAIKDADKVLEEYRSKVAEFYTIKNYRGDIDYWNAFDDSMRALSKAGKTGGKGNPAVLAAALRGLHFVGVTPEVLDLGIKGLEAMRQVPVEYFEAKPQRAVGISEFAAAVVPASAPAKVHDILAKHGITRVELYTDEASRRDAVARASQAAGVLFQDQGPRLPQGATIFTESTQAAIHFFEAKDLSTAPHEVFHVFRRVLENMATTPNASLRVRQDWVQACEFVGARVGEKWTVEQEEKWADAGLTYLMEGKAPSQALKGAMARMKDWLLSLYRTFRNMVAITPEMRGVFDRLLATQDEIRAAEERLHAVPLFRENRPFDYDEALAELRQATEDEVQAYRVGKLATMRKLWAKEGKDLADQAKHQELIDSLVSAGGVRLDGVDLTPQTLQEIRKHRPGKLLVGPEGKLSMAEAADMVGVPTEHLVDWLAQAKKKTAIVREHVEAQTRAFNDDFDAEEAMLSDRLERVLELEAKYLAQAIDGASHVPASALKAWVREKTGQTRADQALIGEFDALKEALRREARAAEKAYRAGKMQEAKDAKERQRAILAELRTRLADQKQALTIQARAVRMADAALKKDSKVDWDWGEQLLRLVVHFGLEGKRKSIFPRSENMPGLLQFIQSKDADGWVQHSGLIPEWIFAEGQGQLGRAHPNHWKNLTVAQLRDVDKALRYLFDQGRKERQYITDGREIELVTIADKLIRSMEGLKDVKVLADYKREGMAGGVQDATRRALAEITNMEYLWDQVDGWEAEGAKGTRTGTAWQYVRLALFNSRTAELREFGRVSRELESILQPLRGKNHRERFELAGVPLLPEVREEWGGLWNHERVLAAALNMGNAGNLAAMKSGFGWTDEHLATIARQLTVDEWRMVQRLWDLIDSLRPLLDAAYFALHGQHMPLVEALPFTVETKDGQTLTLRGGYYPLIGDHRLNDKAGHFAEQDLMKNETMALFAPAKVKDSFTLKRTGMALPPRLSLSVLTRHVQQTIHYATHAVAVRNIQRIITVPEFAAAFKAKFGEHNYRMLTPWLKNIARPDTPEMGFWDGLLEKWRTLGTIAALGMNMQVAMLQLSSIPQSAQSIGWHWLLKGYAAMSNPTKTAEMVRLVRELSPLMRDRLQDMDRDVARNLAKYNPTHRKLQFKVGDTHLEVGMEEFQRWVVFGPISFADACVAYPTWLGAFMKFQAQGKEEATAARMADDVVLRAQASGNPMSQTAMQHGAGWRRLITMFASFTMNYQNRLRHYVRGLREGKVGAVDYARHLFNETLLPVVLSSVLLKLLKDNELPDEKDLAWDSFGYLLSGFPIARGIPRVLEFGYGGVMDSPAFKGVDLVGKSGQHLIKAVMDEGQRGDHLLGFVKDATDLVGFATGVPTAPVFRFAKGVHDLASGEETNPFRPFFAPSPDKKKE